MPRSVPQASAKRAGSIAASAARSVLWSIRALSVGGADRATISDPTEI